MPETYTTTWERAISDSITRQGTSASNGDARPAQTAPHAEADRAISSTFAARATPLATVLKSTNRIELSTVASERPNWSKDRLPILELAPVQAVAKPITVDKYTILPYVDERIAYVAPSEVSLQSFSLVLRRTVMSDGSIRITGGSASFSITTYASNGLEIMAKNRSNWTMALKQNNLGERDWVYLPEKRQGLSVWLELPPGVAASEPLILTSPIASVCNISVELTENGALTWKAALEQAAGSTIAGIVHVSSNSVGVQNVAFRLDRRSLDTTLGILFAGRSAADIRYIDPQQTVPGKVVVVTNDLVQQMVVSLRPSQGQAPANQTFGREGGVVEVNVTTQDVASVTINWSTQATFTPMGWPSIPASGVLNSGNGWTDMIKPDSWLVNYLLMAIPVNSQGQAEPADSAVTTPPIQGVLNFTAPYVANGLLNSTFLTGYLRPINVALPRYPGQPFGDVVLTIFSTRNGVGGMKSRKLSADDLNIVVLVYPDAHVEIRTGSDALAERSAASEVLGVMESL